jgi:hypothetical protein
MGNILKIKVKNFIEWYFLSDSDQEQMQMARDLGEAIIQDLMNGSVTVTPQGILDECNQDIIPLRIVEGLEDEEGEISDKFDTYSVVLI